ncbi:hypothetical protein ACOME3_008390 [Neoechinorhynchus agilis]
MSDTTTLDERDPRTLFCSNLSCEITDEVLFELCVQAGPIEELSVVRRKEDDRVDQRPVIAFIVYKYECSVSYAISLLNGILVYGVPLRLAPRRPKDAQRRHTLPLENQQYRPRQLTISQPFDRPQFLSYRPAIVRQRYPFTNRVQRFNARTYQSYNGYR